MQNRQFGFSNPAQFGRRGFGGQQQQGFGYAPQQDFDEEQDDKFVPQAYLKIKFHTADGIKSLKRNGKDHPLREASELEQMILDHWRAGGDVNELLGCMELEVVDATPKERGTNSFIARGAVPAPAPQEDVHEPERPAPRTRGQRTK